MYSRRAVQRYSEVTNCCLDPAREREGRRGGGREGGSEEEGTTDGRKGSR